MYGELLNLGQFKCVNNLEWNKFYIPYFVNYE